MEKIEEYQLVSKTLHIDGNDKKDLKLFNEEINRLISEGWTPYNGIALSHYHNINKEGVIYQVMVRFKDMSMDDIMSYEEIQDYQKEQEAKDNPPPNN